jgi:hypothetical protein
MNNRVDSRRLTADEIVAVVRGIVSARWRA